MKIRRGWAGIAPPAKLDSPSDCLVKMPYGAPRGAKSPKGLEGAMRLVAAACTLVVVAFLAIFGAILLHERTIADPGPFAPSPNAATAQAPARTPLSTSPVTTVSTSPVSAAPVALASAVGRSAVLAEPQGVAPEQPPVQSFAQAPARPAPPPAAAPAPGRAAP